MYGLLLCFLLCLMIILAHIIPKSALQNQSKEIFLLVILDDDESAEIKIRGAVHMSGHMERKVRGIIAVDTGLSQEGRSICQRFCNEIGGLYLVGANDLPAFLEKTA